MEEEKIYIGGHDPAIIRKETQEAITRGIDNARSQWRHHALLALREICERKQLFTVNDFRKLVDASPYKTHDKRAMGGVIRTGVRLGWIEPSGQEIASRVGHGGPLQVWRSKLYQPGPPTLGI